MTLGTSATPSNSSTTPSVVLEFWAAAKRTNHTANCPRCSAPNMEVRSYGRGPRTEFYIFHHNTCIRVFPTDSQLAQVVRKLAEDGHQDQASDKGQGESDTPPDQSEHNAARDAEDAYTIALQDSLADSSLAAESELIHAYSRAEAIEDGVLVDVSETARQLGFVYPVALTAAVWSLVENIPQGRAGIESTGWRLWDVLWMARLAARAGGSDPIQTIYRLIITRVEGGRFLRNVNLKLHCGPGDKAEPVITISLPNED